jgi:hypothetical protein
MKHKKTDSVGGDEYLVKMMVKQIEEGKLLKAKTLLKEIVKNKVYKTKKSVKSTTSV